MPQTGRMQRRNAALFASALTITALLAGCAGGDDGTEPSESASPGASPTASASPSATSTDEVDTVGYESLWLMPEYAAGVGEPLELDSSLCGIVDGVAISDVERDGDARPHVRGTDIATGEVLWSTEKGRCGDGAALGDSYLVPFSNFAAAYDLMRIDVRTGDSTVFAQMPEDMYPWVVATTDDGEVVIASGDGFVASYVGDGEQVWMTEGIEPNACQHLGTYIGCIGFDGMYNLDPETGELLMEPMTTEDDPEWFTDGFYLSGDAEHGDEVEAFDVTGEPSGTTTTDIPLLCPSMRTGLPVSMHLDIGDGVCIDADGEVVLTRTDDGFEHLPTGTVFADLRSPSLVTADGSAFVASDETSVRLYAGGDTEGILLGDSRTQLKNIDGWLIDDYTDREVTMIYPPAG